MSVAATTGTNGRLAVVAAMSWEGEAAQAGRHLTTSGRTTMLVSGVGQSAARLSAGGLLEQGGLSAVLSVGVAGGLDPGLTCGDVVICRRVTRLENGHAGASWPANAHLLRIIQESLRNARVRARVADSLTTAEVLATTDQKSAAAETGAAVVQMEDSEWAELCAEHGVPFCALRVVIDAIDVDVPPEPSAWQGRPNPIEIAMAVLRRPRLARELAHLAIHRQRSVNALERTLMHVIPSLADDNR